MSNPFERAEQPCDTVTRPGLQPGQMLKKLSARGKDLGGFTVRRLLPTTGQKMLGPWVFFDHMGPAAFNAGSGINVRPHPHIGIATVTYLFAGEILHRDSLGNTQPIVPGDINLMVAGRGITHSERERPEITARDHELHGLQLWLALPEDLEEIEPAFYHYPAREIPAVTTDGVKVRVMMGRAFGCQSPVRTFSDTLYAEAFMTAGQSLRLPPAEELGVYVAGGAVEVDGADLAEYEMAIFETPGNTVLKARTATRIAIIGGRHPGKRFIDWNFVSSRKERISQAKEAWRNGDFPLVVDDENEFIPLP